MAPCAPSAPSSEQSYRWRPHAHMSEVVEPQASEMRSNTVKSVMTRLAADTTTMRFWEDGCQAKLPIWLSQGCTLRSMMVGSASSPMGVDVCCMSYRRMTLLSRVSVASRPLRVGHHATWEEEGIIGTANTLLLREALPTLVSGLGCSGSVSTGFSNFLRSQMATWPSKKDATRSWTCGSTVTPWTALVLTNVFWLVFLRSKMARLRCMPANSSLGSLCSQQRDRQASFWPSSYSGLVTTALESGSADGRRIFSAAAATSGENLLLMSQMRTEKSARCLSRPAASRLLSTGFQAKVLHCRACLGTNSFPASSLHAAPWLWPRPVSTTRPLAWPTASRHSGSAFGYQATHFMYGVSELMASRVAAVFSESGSVPALASEPPAGPMRYRPSSESQIT
ncbi:hypothetical protein EYF80_040128 [Liparis tanakae]|uniref:Uncharacterized protein n=1 Tax=Liparis tanakae TaxID=230148 RepID=A0A4Z2G814_9TELE|nr:hypothetical protein EYF80_040128 [Liparis tanakae]